jgi:hypothetical protein
MLSCEQRLVVQADALEDSIQRSALLQKAVDEMTAGRDAQATRVAQLETQLAAEQQQVSQQAKVQVHRVTWARVFQRLGMRLVSLHSLSILFHATLLFHVCFAIRSRLPRLYLHVRPNCGTSSTFSWLCKSNEKMQRWKHGKRGTVPNWPADAPVEVVESGEIVTSCAVLCHAVSC